jgi:thiol-disulfide isomerase/thioredoxin
VIPLSRWTRFVLALAAIAALSLGAATTAGAAPKRTADTTTYTSASYLREALGLPTKPRLIIESVTYDRFQWLLQQQGKFAFLIGDPATDPTFASRAQDVEAVAEDTGVKQIYWFNPNLSGNAKLGSVTQPNLDIRNPGGITSIGPDTAAVYGTAWLNLVGQYLGNGVKANPTNQNTGSARVTTTPDPSVVNDYGSAAGYSTKVGDTSGGALYDYAGGSAPEDASDSFFFLYDKDDNVTPLGSSTPQRATIVAWVNLTEQASSESTRADVAGAISTCGAANITAISEFDWWKSANNAKQVAQSPNDYQGAGVPNLTDADGATANGGWRVHQITYPELVHFLKTEDSKEAVILFGGTWCPNTRPVLPSINKYAQENDVTVFNFDTILDGGVVGGGNIAGNPLQSRNPAANAGVVNANPSFIYGELVSRYLSNLKTEYLATAANRITYYPGGDTAQALTSQPRLQVPYLFGYKGKEGDDPYGGVNRQWIHDKGDGTYTEYMSVWWFTNPQPNQLGVTPANLPREAPIWTTINSQLAAFTWQTDPEALKVNTAIDTDAAQFLVGTDKATVTFTAPSTLNIASSTSDSAIPISPAALSAALAALGSSAPANYAAARAQLIEALNAATPDEPLIANLKTVAGAWGVSQTRKNRVNSIWGNAGAPQSVAGGIAAVRAAEVFFAGLPDRPSPPGSPSNPNPGGGDPDPGGGGTTVAKIKVRKLSGSVTKAPTSKRRGKLRVKVTEPSGTAKATGKVKVALKKGSKRKTLTGTLKNGVVTVSVPKLAKGKWKVTISWPGDGTYLPASWSGTIKVKK